jgi:hypothetical protein
MMGSRERIVAAVMCVLMTAGLGAQQLLNRVVARVNGEAITLTDVQAAIALGVIQPAGGDPIASGTQLMIDRQLVLVEVQRFPPPEPAPAAIAREIARLEMNGGAKLPAMMPAIGLTAERIHDIARDDLRILGYLDQRFGATVQVSDEEVAQYYRDHQPEFLRGGEPIAFDEAETLARQRASDQRRRATIDQWTRDLRTRADVAVNSLPPAVPAR